MCKCKDVRIGEYTNQVLLSAPDHMPKDNGYSIDACLKDEILYLWSIGITTTGCCCGHNLRDGFIGVIDSDIQKMLDLGYEIIYNSHRPGAIDSFKPKSV